MSALDPSVPTDHAITRTESKRLAGRRVVPPPKAGVERIAEDSNVVGWNRIRISHTAGL
jgi:hypothetical protein